MKFKLLPHDEKLWQQTLKDTVKFLEGKPSGYRKLPPPLVASKHEVIAARKSIHATQKKFAQVVGVSVDTVRAWESGRRSPEGPASKVIRLIRKDKKYAKVFEAA